MNVADVAIPDAVVVAVFLPPAKLPLAPLLGAVNVTVTPLSRFPLASVTVTTSGAPNDVSAFVLCGVPLVAVILAGDPGVFVNEKLAAPVIPTALAVTVYLPSIPFAVNVADVATPDAFVVAVFAPPAKLPLAPLLGDVNVTVTPFTGFPLALVTVTTKGAGKGVLIAALCGVPLVAVTPPGQLFTKLVALTLPIPVAKSQPLVVP